MHKKLIELRKKRGLKQKDMAAILGISKQLYSLIERNETRLTYDRAVRIAKVFDATPDQIFLKQASSKDGRKEVS